MPLLADEDKAVARAYGVLAGPMVRRAIFVDRRAGHRPPPQGDPGRAHLRVGRRPRARRRRDRLMAGAAAAPFVGRRGAGDPRRGRGGGDADRPLPRDHRDPPLRRSTARGRWSAPATGSSPTTPAATASPTRRRRARVMDTRALVDDLERVVAAEVGEGRFLLAGHSMGAHTAVAYALRHPERLAGLVVIGPVYTGEIVARRRWPTGTAWRRRWRRAGWTASSTTSTATRSIDPAWRDSVLRFTRDRMLLHRHPEALVEALREVPRSRPFESMDGAGGGSRSRRWSSPATTTADPGHPYAAAAAYAERLPRARLISEARGGVAAGLAGRQALAGDSRLLHARLYRHHYEIPDRSHAAPDHRLRGGPRDRRRHLHHDRRLRRRRADLPGRRRRLRDGRQQLLLAHRRRQRRRLRDRRLRGAAG